MRHLVINCTSVKKLEKDRGYGFENYMRKLYRFLVGISHSIIPKNALSYKGFHLYVQVFLGHYRHEWFTGIVLMVTNTTRLDTHVRVMNIGPPLTWYNRYCITGIFPGTFISRKIMFSTFSRFLISRPAHGCTDIIFTESVCFRF